MYPAGPRVKNALDIFYIPLSIEIKPPTIRFRSKDLILYNLQPYFLRLKA